MDTANANCWSRAASYLRVSMADYIGIRETKIPGGQPCAEAAVAGKATKWKLPVGECLALNGLSCGVAVAAKSHLGLGDGETANLMAAALGIGQRLLVRHSGGI